MEYSAIYHDMDKRFCYAIDKDLFVIRVQVKKDDMKEIILHCEDKYIPMERKDTKKTILMKKIATSQFHDYYEAQLQMHLICLRYYFEFTDTQGEKIYYGNYEFYKECITNRDRMFDCPQNLREEEMFEVPDWAANKVVYQIFPARFAASQQVDKEQWYKAPISSMDDLHGDLRGIIEHLDHVQNLGIDVLYMTPIFKSYSSHKYDIIDYYQIDPSFGTTEDLRELVQEAHKRGMKIVMDAVFNHTGREFFAFEDIMEKGEKSKYLDWYYIEKFPLESERGEIPNYKCFGYYGGMPMIYYGDEFAMPGANDPDCRRGMYWDEEYQDKEMYEWYKQLLWIRKKHACISEGELIGSITKDEEETIVLIRKNVEETIALIFNCSSNARNFSEYEGKYNLLRDEPFDGKVEGLDAAVIVL